MDIHKLPHLRIREFMGGYAWLKNIDVVIGEVISLINARSMKLDQGWLGIIYILISAFGFSTLGIFGKLIYAEGLNVSSTLVLRFVGATVMLWTWLIWRGEWRIPWREAGAIIGLGLFGYAGQAAFLFSALNHTTAGIATLLLYTYPAIVCLLVWLLEGHRPPAKRIAALGLALVGCLCIADLTMASTSLLGILLGLASGLWYSFYLFFSTRLAKSIPPLVTTAYVSLGAAISFVGGAIATSSFIPLPSFRAVLLASALVIVSTIVPILSLFTGIQHLGISQASILSTVEPLITVLLGMVFLGEVLSPLQSLGGLLIMASVIVLQLRSH